MQKLQKKNIFFFFKLQIQTYCLLRVYYKHALNILKDVPILCDGIKWSRFNNIGLLGKVNMYTNFEVNFIIIITIGCMRSQTESKVISESIWIVFWKQGLLSRIIFSLKRRVFRPSSYRGISQVFWWSVMEAVSHHHCWRFCYCLNTGFNHSVSLSAPLV